MPKDKKPPPPDNIILFPNVELINPQSRLIEVDGVVEIPDSITLEQFEEAFAKFIELNDWYFDGGIEDITNE